MASPLPLHPAVARMRPPASQADLLAVLDALEIAHSTLAHRPVFTVAEGADIKAQLPGGHTKNLFLEDRNGRLLLISALGETPVRLNRIHRALGYERLSFAKPETLLEALGVAPGSVTIFALINDPARRVGVALDAALLAHEVVNFHPLANTATTAISSADLLAFVRACGREPQIAPLAAMGAQG